MVLCEYVHTNPGSLTRTILNTFSSILVESFPMRISQMAVYAALTDGRGKTPITLTLAHVDGDILEQFTCTTVVDFDDPIADKEISFQFNGLVLDAPGDLRVQLYCNAELLSERRLYVRAMPE
jgi:hypothetical protein